MKRALLLLIITLLLSCSVQEGGEVFSPELIAHAGGGIDSCIYTNSREALMQAVDKGYRFVEFDFLFTSDSILVAAHSWSDFNRMTGYSHLGDTAPLFNDFSTRKIYGCYTPLSAFEINAFIESHTQLFLVTDKVSTPEVLQCYFPNIKERMVVEAFSYQDYCRLKSDGYFRVLYSCMANDLTKTFFSNNSLSILNIEWLALHTSAFDNPIFKFINSIKPFEIALFTVDNIDSIPTRYRGMVKMVYTNFIAP